MIIDFEIAQSLDRAVSPLWRDGSRVDLENVSAMDLRYQYFWSRIQFAVEGYDLGTRWGRLPLLDFAASAKRLLGSLSHDGRGEIDFTENSTVISFTRRRDVVEIQEATGRMVRCGMDELTTAIVGFLQKVATILVDDHPDIERNRFFNELVSDSEVT